VLQANRSKPTRKLFLHHPERKVKTSLQSYLDHAADGIYIIDIQTGRILNANKRAEQMLGYSREELLKLSAAEIEVSLQQPAIHDAHLRTNQGAVTVEGIHRRKDASTFPVDIRLASLGPEQPRRVLAHVRDITERKRVEEVLRDEAKRKDEFLALLGHELRNPLAAISTAVQVFTGDLTPERQTSLKEMISGQVLLMQRLLDDLLDLGRITHGHIELRKEGIGLAEFLQKATESVQSTIANRCQELLVRLSSDSVQFMADPTRLEQITTNLLSNASKYTHQGGRIELSGGKEGSDVVLCCKDNGRGIPPDMRQRIFEPFTRGVTASDSHGEASLGIGLTLAKQLAELHGGTISVESGGPGMGSEFTVRLPFVAPPSDQPELVNSRSAPHYHTRSIVVVEDNPAVAKAMEFALKKAGHKVHTFPDGPSALAGVSELKPDAVVLDIGLPGMDGYELATKLKDQKSTRNALFIAISGFKRREHAARAADDFDHYFTKPVDVGALLALLDRRSGAVPANASRDRQEPEKSRQLLRVLLVEDHVGLAAATATLLRGEGLEVQTAFTGRAALEAAPGFRPQLILCDMNLPDMKGPEVIRELRLNPSIQRAHAVILTAMSETSLRTYNGLADKLGVDAFMSKPIASEAIRTLVSTLNPQGYALGRK
jgi:PAS domain S-box-containing protein